MSLSPVSESGIASLWSRGSSRQPAAASPAVDASAAVPGSTVASPGGSVGADQARQAVSQALHQALAQWQQQQSSLLKQAEQRKQSNSQPLDGSRMEMLKERVKNLRQMLLLVGNDKGGLRAIALQLKQITAELRQMVANASGQGQAAPLDISVNVTTSGSADASQPDVAGNQSNTDTTSTTATSAAATDSSATAPAPPAMASTGSTGNPGLGGNMELQALLNSIKAIAQWLKQRSQQVQTQDEGLKKWLDGSNQDLAAIDHMLAGGSNSAQGELSVTIQLTLDGADAGDSASADGSSAGSMNIQA